MMKLRFRHDLASTHMTRWIMLVVTLGALLLMLFGPTPGWISLGVIVFVIGGLATALAFVHARISSRTLPEELEGQRILREQSRDRNPGDTNHSD